MGKSTPEKYRKNKIAANACCMVTNHEFVIRIKDSHRISPRYLAAVTSSFATVRVLSRLHSPRHSCSCCSVATTICVSAVIKSHPVFPQYCHCVGRRSGCRSNEILLSNTHATGQSLQHRVARPRVVGG